MRNDLQDLFPLQIAQTLQEYVLMGMGIGNEGGESCSRHAGARLVTPGASTEFLGGDQQFFLGVPLQRAVVRGTTHDPVALHVGIDHPHIKWIIAHRDARFDHFGIAEVVIPVVKMIHLDPTAPLHLGTPFRRTGAGVSHKGLVVGNAAMLALPTVFHAPKVCLAWRLPNATVLALIVDLVGPLHQVRVEVPKRPDGLFLGVNSFGEQASLLGRLTEP